MQDFSYERLRTQEAALEPYILYRKDQAVQAERNVRIRDFEYFKSMYPDRVKALQLVVEEVCDEMEYEGSPIYDEYPDRILMEQMIQKIAQRAEVSDEKPEQAEMTTEEVEPEEIQETLPRVSYGPVRNEYGGGEGYFPSPSPGGGNPEHGRGAGKGKVCQAASGRYGKQPGSGGFSF